MAYVLIIDDDDFGDAAARALRDAGHEVQIELDPGDGLVSMKARRPDLLVLDVMFPWVPVRHFLEKPIAMNVLRDTANTMPAEASSSQGT